MENLVKSGNLTLDFSAYRNKKVFLTGHTGFKGSWMLAWLHELGAIVKGYALAPHEENALYTGIQGDSLCHSIIGDIRDKERLENELLTFQPDFIFHLAAQPLVRLSYEIPLETWEVNVLGTAYLLEAVRKLEKPCAVVLITTDKVYENKEWHYPYRESDRLGGYDPYSASKAGAELVIASYRNSFFNTSTHHLHNKSIASARAGNVIGGGDWAKDRIIPDIVRALQKGEEVVVRNPHSVRPWQHVLDPVSGYLILGQCLKQDHFNFAKPYNFGPAAGESTTVEQLVNLAIDAYGSGTYEIKSNPDQPHEAGTLKLDISRAKNELNWKPKWSEAESIQRTVRWYKKFYSGQDSKELVLEDITSYIEN
jgi:CDP-glucose 4,6-dehydratase